MENKPKTGEEKSPQVINGKRYQFWQQFVDAQVDWIGGKLQDSGDSFDRSLGAETMTTDITGVTLKPNGKDSAFFEVHGKEFGCGFDVKYGGIKVGEEGWVTFSGYGGHTWRIQKKI